MPLFFGKLIGGILGYLFAGPFGAILGLMAGHLFDKGLASNFQMANPEHLQRVQDVFFTTVFSLMGRLAKSDGRISEQEIQQAEHFMGEMGLTQEHRDQAIVLFKKGAEASFDLESMLSDFQQYCAPHPKLSHMLLIYLIGMAMADGEVHSAEEQILRHVATALNVSPRAFEQLLQQLKAQQRFSGQGAGVSSADAIGEAYKALGVTADMNDKDIKKAYRRLMSQYHPDKLIAEGMPEDMIKVATEKSQEIQSAYELIKKHRKG